MPLRAGVVHLLVFLVALDPVAPIAAQQADSSEQKTFFVGSDIVWLGTFTLGSYGLSRVDPRITQYFQQPRHQGSGKLRSLDEKQLVVEAQDTRIITLKRTARTKFTKDGAEMIVSYGTAAAGASRTGAALWP